MTNRSRVNDPHILAQKHPKMAIFEKADYWGLKDPLEVRVQHETCSTICGTPVPAILNLENLTGLAAKIGYRDFWLLLAPPAECCQDVDDIDDCCKNDVGDDRHHHGKDDDHAC